MQVLILSGLTWEPECAEQLRRIAGHGMLRRFTWKLVYQIIQESQAEILERVPKREFSPEMP